jgi:pimeloyl-ACP methyl ester carboxylesterase
MDATHSCFVLHGALGSGQNFRAFVKRLAQQRPDIAFVLVDLRAHGDSDARSGPHTLERCALDLEELAEWFRRGADPLPQLEVVVGHSLGGKVALEFGRLSANPLRQVWALDSDPGSQEPGQAHEIQRVISAVRQVQMPAPSRAAVVTALCEQGLSSGLANWMTTNLKRASEDYRWTFDLTAIDALLEDYFARDLWPFVEAVNPSLERHLVIACNSDRWSGAMRARADALDTSAGVFVHHLPNAGHWLHVDNPDGLLALLAPRLPSVAAAGPDRDPQ